MGYKIDKNYSANANAKKKKWEKESKLRKKKGERSKEDAHTRKNDFSSEVNTAILEAF